MVVFFNGFEDDLASWTVDAGVPIIVNTPVHHGVKACNMPSGVASQISKGFVAMSPCYTLGYFYMTAYPGVGEAIDFVHMTTAGGAWASVARLSNVGGVITWLHIYHDNGWTLTTTDSGVTPTLNVWHSVGLGFIKGVVGGSILYFNGVPIVTCAGTSMNDDANSILFTGGATADYVCDCMYIDSAYINPEPSGFISRSLKGVGL